MASSKRTDATHSETGAASPDSMAGAGGRDQGRAATDPASQSQQMTNMSASL